MSIILVDLAAANVLPLAVLCKRPFVSSWRVPARLLSRQRHRRMRDVEVLGPGGGLEINSPVKSMQRRARTSSHNHPLPPRSLAAPQLKAE